MPASPIRYEQDAGGVVTVTFDAPGAPVNTMTEAGEAAFTDTVARLAKEKASFKGTMHPPFADGNCIACHDPHGGATGKNLVNSNVNQLCLTCHAEGDYTPPPASE